MRKWNVLLATAALGTATMIPALAAFNSEPKRESMSQAIAYEKHKAAVSETAKPDPFDSIATAGGENTASTVKDNATRVKTRRQQARETAAAKRQK